jgi:hypothetical protein
MPAPNRSPLSPRSALLGASAIAASLLSCTAALAEPGSEATGLAELRRELEEMRAEQARSSKRIADLEAALAHATSGPVASPAPAAAPAAVATAQPTPGFAPPPASRLKIAGDMRLRYEANFGDRDARNRDRGVLRARLRASYDVTNWLTAGAQIATGDPDDPNSSDITLSNFDDDLQVSLDQAYLRATFGGLQIYGGKMPQPFVRTELVWDGDVNPQGLSASYSLPLGSGTTLKASGLYFLVDESVAGPNSDMIGGQIGIEAKLATPLKLELAAAYYDYSLRSLAGSDSGDIRSNLFAGGRYLSDFDLVDIIAAVTWQGANERWPLRIVGDYVKNLGAATSQDSGFGVDVLLGRASKKGDWRFTYGYAQAATDAVLAAFSQDNTNIGTNYRQHSLSVDFVPVPNLTLNATYYRYRPLKVLNAGANDPNDWLDRVRLNLLTSF